MLEEQQKLEFLTLKILDRECNSIQINAMQTENENTNYLNI